MHKYTLEEFRQQVCNSQMSLYMKAAQDLGIKSKILIKGILVEFEKDNKKWRIHKSLLPINDSVSMMLSSYKSTCNQFLGKNSIPVPIQISTDKSEDIHKFVEQNHLAKIVIKPIRGFGGSGITMLPQKNQIDGAFNLAYEKALTNLRKRVIAEEFISGENYRILVLGGKVIAAIHRIPAFVVGNGKSTIEELIKQKNIEKSKNDAIEIPVDNETLLALKDQDLSIESVPQKQERIKLRFNANFCTGGSTRECLAEVHEEYKKIAIAATKLLGLKFSGIDLITPDISNTNVKYAINEVNHDPGLRIHYNVDEGEKTDIAVIVQKYILENYNN
ncbi:ATP-grasp domain-containing protein [Candidatus Dojkabacteria bacterium]|nr:ATP-grasp domain-containing protein [Candidatus Dojkabacteria bacterium]